MAAVFAQHRVKINSVFLSLALLSISFSFAFPPAKAVSSTIVIIQVHGGAGCIPGGCTDTDNNNSDFTTGAPNPRNTASPTASCSAPTLPNLYINDVSQNEGISWTTTFSFTVSLSAPAGAGGVIFDIATADNTATTADSDYVDKSLTGQIIPEGSSIFNFDVLVDGDATSETDETFFVNVTNVTGANVTDGQGIGTIRNDDPQYIRNVQGTTHTSPYDGQNVTLRPAVVTAIRSTGISKGFWLESPEADWDASDDTSEGIFVYTGSSPITVNVGDAVMVSGRVNEYGASPNLTATELGSTLTITPSTPLAMPPAVVVGAGGRIPPTTVVEDDGFVTFDTSQDGIDFWESLEGMHVQLNSPQVVGPTRTFASSHTQEIPLLGDSGANATAMTPRGGIIIRGNPNDMNPERIILQMPDTTPLMVNVGAKLGPAALHGVIDYNYNNFKFWPTDEVTILSNNLQPTTATAQGTNQLAFATFNVENLAPTDPSTKFDTLANQILNNLKAPDILAVEEIQDNSGATDDGTVAADVTWGMLIQAIKSASSNTIVYDYRQIDPVNNQDGGVPGGNIRVGLVFRTDRGLRLIDRPGGDSTTATTVVNDALGVHLSFSPGRIDPSNSAWTTPAGTRRSLAAEFTFNGHHLFVIANHLKSKSQDDPLFGRLQPPILATETQRTAQAQLLRDFVNGIVTLDPNADVVVLGDLNDFQFSNPLVTLKGSILDDLIETRPENERYTYVYDGNSETLDHILVSHHLFNSYPFVYQPIHVNAEFYNQVSDHDPQVATFTLNPPPSKVFMPFVARGFVSAPN